MRGRWARCRGCIFRPGMGRCCTVRKRPPDAVAIPGGLFAHHSEQSPSPPERVGYRRDRLEGRQAVRYREDRRLSVGHESKADELQEKIRLLCTRCGETIDKNATSDPEATFVRLQNELVDNLDRLFVFVAHPQVEPTNNRSERNVRRKAEIRKGGRTSKSHSGARRRGVIMTVLASLRTRLPQRLKNTQPPTPAYLQKFPQYLTLRENGQLQSNTNPILN